MLVYQRVYDLMEHGVLVYTSEIIGLTLTYSDSWSEPYTCGPIGCPNDLPHFEFPPWDVRQCMRLLFCCVVSFYCPSPPALMIHFHLIFIWRFPEMGGTPTWMVYNWTFHRTWWFGGCPYFRKPPYSWMFFCHASGSTATQNMIDFRFLSVSLSSGWTINICNMTRPRPTSSIALRIRCSWWWILWKMGRNLRTYEVLRECDALSV